MAADDKKRVQITIPSYQGVFNFEKRVYSFMNVVLPVSVSYSDLAYFFLSAIAMGLLYSIVRRPVFIPSVTWEMLLFLGVPAAITKYGRKMQLDGKNTFVFIKDYILFFINRGTAFEGLRPIKSADAALQKGKARWRCTYKSP